MDCQHSFNETGSKASLHIEISVIAFSSALEKSTLLGGIKLADYIGTKSSNSKAVKVSTLEAEQRDLAF